MPCDPIHLDSTVIAAILEQQGVSVPDDDLLEVVERLNALLAEAATWDAHEPFDAAPWSPTMVRRA